MFFPAWLVYGILNATYFAVQHAATLYHAEDPRVGVHAHVLGI